MGQLIIAALVFTLTVIEVVGQICLGRVTSVGGFLVCLIFIVCTFYLLRLSVAEYKSSQKDTDGNKA